SQQCALLRVRQAMLRARKQGRARLVHWALSLLDALGFLDRERGTWLQSRVPSRFQGPDHPFWRHQDTAMITNLGVLAFPEPLSQWVAGIHGFAPVISPSISLSILTLGGR